MKLQLLRNIFTLTLFIVSISSCSNSSNIQKDFSAEIVEVTAPIERSFSFDGVNIPSFDTTILKTDLVSKLELARQHYLAGLEAFDSEDSLTTVQEFESAIVILDELYYYPDIEKNEEFNELSKSIIEDYDKIIASVDQLGPETPIFAFREKISSEAELIDIKKDVVKIPKIIPNTTVPLDINEKVEQFISFFNERGSKFLPTWYYKSGIYFPMMKRIFAEEGLPQEIIYLSLIESGLNPIVRSWANAVGIWQFIKATGEISGLKVNFWTDERRDPEKATRAAARHLKELYDIYEDWHLVLAAYNCGGGRVNYALRRSKANDYWSISRYLPKETRGYVPQYIAISLMFMNPTEYGLDKYQLGKPYDLDTISINECIDLSVLSNCINIGEYELQLMNPELVQGCTPPNQTFLLKIPKNLGETLLANLKNVPESEKRSFFFHIVRKGETPTSIAKKYHIPKATLFSLNNLDKFAKRKKSKIPKGLALKIPLKYVNTNSITSENIVETIVPEKSKSSKNNYSITSSEKSELIYIVKENDDLKTIANLFDVRTSDIRNWNDISYNKTVDVGDSISIFVSSNKFKYYNKINSFDNDEKHKLIASKTEQKPKTEKGWLTHRIKKGETLGVIAENYNVDLKSIKRWNKIKKNIVIIGQKLKIYSNVPTSTITENDIKEKDITYKVKEGETLFSIAKKNKLKLQDLAEYNDIKTSDPIKSGQTLRLIPLPSTKKTKSNSDSKFLSKKPEDFKKYNVKSGDNLFSIAKSYNVSVDNIKEWNSLIDEKIKLGQVLKIYSSNISSSKGDNSGNKTSVKKEIYKIRKGDTLYSIAKKYNTTVFELKKWNKNTDQLMAGNKLIIYR